MESSEVILMEVIKDLVMQYQKNPTPELFERILKRVDNLVLKTVNIARSLCPHLLAEDPDDLYQTAIMGLYPAITTTKEDEDPYYVVARLIAYMKCELKKGYPYKVLAPGFLEEQEEFTSDDDIFKNLNYENLLEILNKFVEENLVSSDELDFIKMRYMQDMSCEEISKVSGISTGTVREKIEKAILRIQHQIRIRNLWD